MNIKHWRNDILCKPSGAPVGQLAGFHQYAPRPDTASYRWIEPVEERFERLAAEWRRDTEHLSSTTAIVSHSAYRQIIDMGSAIIPLILSDLERNGGYWFPALEAINQRSAS